jgi:hypothetical protein
MDEIFISHLIAFECRKSSIKLYLKSFSRISILVNVDMADSFGVAENWNHLALLLDGSNQIVGASRDHQIDVFVQLEQITDGFASGNLHV